MENTTRISYYAKSIHEITKCDYQDLEEVEDIMRNDVVHSTLDWLTEEQFEVAALTAYDILKSIREEKNVGKKSNAE